MSAPRAHGAIAVLGVGCIGIAMHAALAHAGPFAAHDAVVRARPRSSSGWLVSHVHRMTPGARLRDDQEGRR